KSYAEGVVLGATMVGQTVGEVLESKNEKIKKGDKVLTQLGWQLYGCAKEVSKVDGARAPLTYYLGILGMPGITAYFGLKELGQPKPGETVLVSAASGAVGSVVGQLAKLWGARAVGIAGGREKCNYVSEELGFDACIDYKAGAVREHLKAACPNGVDVYFDNVGGEILDTALASMMLHGRVVVCGMIADYNAIDTYRVTNWHKIHIMLEETGLEYRVHPIDIGAGDQFKPDFLAISPNNKIPAMIDQRGPDGKPFALAESGAMLFYLASKTGKFLPKDIRK